MLEAIEIAEPGLTAHVLIEPEEVQLMGRPSVQCIVEVVSEGFVGVNRSVFFDFEDLERFIQEADRLLNTNSGAATLDTMSPGRLKMVIQPLGKAGQLQAVVSMEKRHLGHELVVPAHRLETGFEVERFSLSEALIALRKLMKDGRAG